MTQRTVALLAIILGCLNAPTTCDAGQFAAGPDGDLFVVDNPNGLEAIVLQDAATGNRRILSNQNLGAGTPFETPRTAGFDANGNLLVIDHGTRLVVRVDRVTGDRTTVLSLDGGAGPALSSNLGGAAFEQNGDLVIMDVGYASNTVPDSIVRVDRSTGDRSVVSDDVTGQGPAFQSPGVMVVEASGNLLVAARGGLDALIRVDPVTGDRTILSDDDTGVGPPLQTLRGIALDPSGDIFAGVMWSTIQRASESDERHTVPSATVSGGQKSERAGVAPSPHA